MFATGRRRALAALAAAALAGCSALAPRGEAPTLRVLAPAPAPRGPGPARDVVVEVAPPRAWPGYDTREVVYVSAPYQLDVYAASQWADTPARMLGPLVVRALEDSSAFRAVVAAPATVPADLRVDVELQRLQQSFAATPSRAELALRVQVTDLRSRRVLATRVIEESEPAASADAAGGVAAANAALRRALAALADACAAAAASR